MQGRKVASTGRDRLIYFVVICFVVALWSRICPHPYVCHSFPRRGHTHHNMGRLFSPIRRYKANIRAMKPGVAFQYGRSCLWSKLRVMSNGLDQQDEFEEDFYDDDSDEYYEQKKFQLSKNDQGTKFVIQRIELLFTYCNIHVYNSFTWNMANCIEWMFFDTAKINV